MVCDAHIHMGYYPRAGYAELFYYSPLRIVGLMDRCDVDEFIVSSTCAQVEETMNSSTPHLSISPTIRRGE